MSEGVGDSAARKPCPQSGDTCRHVARLLENVKQRVSRPSEIESLSQAEQGARSGKQGPG